MSTSTERPASVNGGPVHVVPPLQARTDLTEVVAAGTDAYEALTALIGPRVDRRTGDVLTDCAEAVRAVDELKRSLHLHRALVTRALYRQVKSTGCQDPWSQVGKILRYPRSEVRDWVQGTV